MLVTVAEVDDLDAARVLVAALTAHGFHPLEIGDGGFPGVACPSGGIPIAVPEDEQEDAGILARALLKEFGT